MPDTSPAVEQEQPTGIAALIAKTMKLKLVRVLLHFVGRGGPLMGSGLAYQAIFAVFAGIWVGFSIIGLVVQRNVGLRTSIIDSIAAAVPGLIDPGDGSGAIDPSTLLDTAPFSLSGIVSLAVLLFIAVGFLASARDAVRRIFELHPVPANFLLLKLKDLALAIAFGAAIVLSTVLSSASTVLLGFVLDILGIGSDSLVATVLGRASGLAVVLALDTVVLAALYRVLSGIPIPRRRLFGGALLGAVGLGILKFLGNTLLGRDPNNPLLASFAIIVGLLIFFNLVCQVILVCGAWIAIGMKDNGIAADPEAAEAERLEKERIAELERIAAEARRPGPLGRLLRRLRPRRGESAGGDARGGKADAAK